MIIHAQATGNETCEVCGGVIPDGDYMVSDTDGYTWQHRFCPEETP